MWSFSTLFKEIPLYQGRLADTLPYPYGDELRGINETTGLPLGECSLNLRCQQFDLCV